MGDPYSQTPEPVLCVQLVYRTAGHRTIPILDSNDDLARFEVQFDKGDLGFALEILRTLERDLKNPYHCD